MVKRLPLIAAGFALVLAGLAGCAGGETYSAQTSTELQHTVRDVATLSAAKDYAGALAKLDALGRLNDAAAKNGSISAARHDAVAGSIASIRADLGGLQDAAEKAQLQQQIQQLQQQQQQQQQGGDKKNGDGKGKKGDGEGGD